jgi:hypothetical protein
MSGFNSLWLFSFFRPLGGNMYRLTSVKVAQVKISQTKNSGQKFRPKIQARNSGQKWLGGYGKDMTRISIIFLMLTGLAAVGLVVLSNWQIPSPTVVINKVIFDETLPK